MNKATYQAIRQQVRDNGRYALRWLHWQEKAQYTLVLACDDTVDLLAARQHEQSVGVSKATAIRLTTPDYLFDRYLDRTRSATFQEV